MTINLIFNYAIHRKLIFELQFYEGSGQWIKISENLKLRLRIVFDLLELAENVELLMHTLKIQPEP